MRIDLIEIFSLCAILSGANDMIVHSPVLLNEVLRYLDPQQNQTLFDATVGQG